MRVQASNPKYPRNWNRASKTLRRVVGHCERCQYSKELAVHHKGLPFADGTPGNPFDKHDLRRENLEVICFRCHDAIENVKSVDRSIKEKRRRKRRKLEAHRALGIGTGLVPYQSPCMIVQGAL